MIHPSSCRGLVLILALAPVGHLQAQFVVKEETTAAPKELKAPVAKLLGAKSYQFQDNKGTILCEVWFRKDVPAKATPEQVKNGLTYREIQESTLVGAIRIDKAMNDYRKQKIKEGVYTMRLGYQPMDGDHQGSAPNPEFCLLIPAGEDADPAEMAPKKLHDKSTKASGAPHPAVLLLMPLQAKGEPGAKVVAGSDNHWSIVCPVTVQAGEIKTLVGFVLTLVGVSSAA